MELEASEAQRRAAEARRANRQAGPKEPRYGVCAASVLGVGSLVLGGCLIFGYLDPQGPGTVSNMDLGFYLGVLLCPLLTSLYRIHVLVILVEALITTLERESKEGSHVPREAGRSPFMPGLSFSVSEAALNDRICRPQEVDLLLWGQERNRDTQLLEAPV